MIFCSGRSCGRTWTFERFIDRELAGHVDQTVSCKQNGILKKKPFFTIVESVSGSWSDQGRMRGQVFERVCLPFSQLRPCQARVSPEQGRQVHQTQRLCGQTGGRLPGKPVPIR